MDGEAAQGEAEREAQRLQTTYIHPSLFVASAGDVVGYDGRYIAHRASSSQGISGAALRPVEQPGLFLGTHLGAESKCCLVLRAQAG